MLLTFNRKALDETAFFQLGCYVDPDDVKRMRGKVATLDMDFDSSANAYQVTFLYCPTPGDVSQMLPPVADIVWNDKPTYLHGWRMLFERQYPQGSAKMTDQLAVTVPDDALHLCAFIMPLSAYDINGASFTLRKFELAAQTAFPFIDCQLTRRAKGVPLL